MQFYPYSKTTHNQKRKLQSRMHFTSKIGNILKKFRDKSMYFCSVVLTVSIDCYLSWTSVSKSGNSKAKLRASDLDGFYVTSQQTPENLDFIFFITKCYRSSRLHGGQFRAREMSSYHQGK
jgi:hypothetical protein